MNTLQRTLTEVIYLDLCYDTDTVACDDCQQPAAMIGTGHRHQSCPQHPQQPPFFKCAVCHTRWFTNLADIIAAGYALQCAHCNLIFDTIDKFSRWRPV